MSRKEKLLKKFLERPESLRCREIIKLLLNLGFEEAGIKGSHLKFRHPNLKRVLTISVHDGDCKSVYKASIAKIIKNKIL